jgi:hypothetical protein
MTFEQILLDVGATVAAVSAISTVLAHLPFMPAKYAEFFARLAIYAANWKFSVNQRDTLPKPKDEDVELPPTFPGALVLLLAAGLALHSQACIRGLTPKTIDQAAIILCDTFFSQQKPGLSLEDVEKAFCSTADQIEPFLSSAKIAAQHAGEVRMQRSEQP